MLMSMVNMCKVQEESEDPRVKRYLSLINCEWHHSVRQGSSADKSSRVRRKVVNNETEGASLAHVWIVRFLTLSFYKNFSLLHSCDFTATAHQQLVRVDGYGFEPG